MGFEPIRTERLILRSPVPGDADAANERRSLPEVARYQDWELPYPRERAEQQAAKAAEMGGPQDGQGWMATVVDAADAERIMGDIYIGIEWEGRCAEVGYTFHPDHWGKGYATEATEAVVRYLFDDFGVDRVRASLHPDNTASARVLEACGFVYEGLTRESFWVGDECSDDLLYGLPRSAWDAWCNRPRHRPERVELVPLTADNAEAVGALATHWSQERFVSPMAENFRDALVLPTIEDADITLWYRAIEADGEIAGFIMVREPSEARPNPYLGRLLIDRMQQRRGVGTAALRLFEQRCREQGAAAMEVAWGAGPGSPERFYLAFGFEPTGEVRDGDIQGVKRLT